jgi:hypothetical protein
MKTESSEILPLVTRDRDKVLICFNRTEVGKEGNTLYQYDSAWTTFPFDRSKLISDLVRSRYTADQVEAIILNGNDTEKHAEEYSQLQAWRVTCKHIADQIISSND